EPPFRRGADPAGGLGRAYRGLAAAGRGPEHHAVPGHGPGRERDRYPQRAAFQHGQTALAPTSPAPDRDLPDRAVRRRYSLLADQRAAVPASWRFGAARARSVGGARRAGSAAVATPAPVPGRRRRGPGGTRRGSPDQGLPVCARLAG